MPHLAGAGKSLLYQGPNFIENRDSISAPAALSDKQRRGPLPPAPRRKENSSHECFPSCPDSEHLGWRSF